MKISRLILGLLVSATFLFGKETTELKVLLQEEALIGSIVIKKVGDNNIITNDSIKAHELYRPASTFKILNTLIAIDGNYIRPNDTIKWDGKNRSVISWNGDQTIHSAFKSSCVWAFEIIEKKIGTNIYQKMLNDIHYGNMNAGTKDTAFWLYGDLRISSYDQIQFLEKICLRTLNFKNSSYDLLKEIMTEYKGEKYSLYGKTGWVDDIGWYVGYIETSSNEVWVFATRIEGAKINSNQMGKRKEISIQALKAIGAIK